MTDQSPNDAFHASSFVQGHNAGYIEQLYARYANDPNVVVENWRAFFKSLGDAPADARAEAAGRTYAPRAARSRGVVQSAARQTHGLLSAKRGRNGAARPIVRAGVC